MRKYNVSQKVWAIVLTVVMVLGMLPVSTFAVEAESVVRQADPSTMNGYQELFLDPDTVGVELTTENAGGVWTDKSVFAADQLPAELTGATSEENTTISMTDTGDNFLVALSAIASNKEIVGYSTRPTDTMLVLDLSGSMGMSSSAGYVRSGNRYTEVTHYDHTMVAAMIEAANDAIHRLLTLNNHNRVGVVLYSGNSQAAASGADTAQLLLPLDRYQGVQNGSKYEYLEYALTQETNTLYQRSGNRYQSIGQQTYTTAITASVKDNLKTEAGADVTDASKVTLGGTYIQNGLYKAWQEFEKADTVIADGSIQAGETRMPIMMLMSDGAPTTATHLYTGSDGSMGTSTAGTGQSTTAGIAFLTQLTAAWTLAKMEEHYNTEGKFYTLGLDTGSDYDTSVLDPANGNNSVKSLWNTYLALGSNTMTLSDLPNTNNMNQYHSSTISKDALINEMVYVDEYFPASSAQEMINAFQSIVDEIILQSKYYPTYVEKDYDHDGYVTFADKIGGYMEVTEVHGIVIGDTLYSGALLARGFYDGSLFGTVDNPTNLGDELVRSVKERLGIADTAVARQLLQNAYNYGQFSYVSDTEFSNYIGWYADENGNYLDFWYEGITSEPPVGATHIVKSYGMLGQTDEAHGISAADMMYASIRVSQEVDDYDGDGIPNETMLTWQIPASLVPTITYQVEVDVDNAGKITEVKDLKLENENVKPIRLLYEVALRDDITEWNISTVVSDAYADSTENKDAGYVFYTNQWKKENGTADTTRNTYSHFEPSVQNEWYYYTEDAIIYTDENGTAYTGAAAPSTSGTYYRSYQVFEKLETGAYRIHTHYEQISAESLAAAEPSGSNWVIPKGTVFRFWDPFQEGKTANNTDTHAYAEYPTITYDGASGHYYALDVLGNNGKLTVTPATGIKLTKTVEEVVSGTEDNEFQFVISGGSGSATLIRLDANGQETSRQELTFSGGQAEFILSADETVYITGLEDGKIYTVSEKGNDVYKVASVTVNGAAVSGREAVIAAVSQSIQSADFVNAPKTVGGVYITKTVESDTSFPADALFDLTVTLEGNEKTDFVITATDMSNPDPDAEPITLTDYTYADGVITGLQIANNQTIKISGLTEGAKVTVMETSLPEGFALESYSSINHTGLTPDDDNVVEIFGNMDATVLIKNAYTPASIPAKVSFNGIKFFDALKMTEDAQFTFRLQKYENGQWVDVDTDTLTIPAGTADAAENFTFEPLVLILSQPGTHSYQILEDKGDNEDVTYDRSVYTFSVIVTDNGDGTLKAELVTNAESGDEANFNASGATGDWTVTTAFRNEYHTTATSIDIQKTITDNAGSGKTGQGFEIETYVAAVTPEGVWTEESFIRSAVTDAEGQTRLVRNYDNTDFLADLDNDNVVTYHFIVKEKNAGAAGWQYDPTHYLMTVVLRRTVGGDGTESITADFSIVKGVEGENHTFTAGEPVVVEGNTGLLSFHNTYTPAQAEVDLDIVPTVVKHLEGRALNDGEFTFAVFEDGKSSFTDTTGALAVGTNDAQGNVLFNNKLTFTQVGTYHFDVVEITGSLGGVNYDTTIYDMTVVVTDVGGALTADYYFEDSVNQQVTFTNSYDAEDAQLALSGEKTLTGRPLVNAEFRFKLTEVTDETGAAVKDGGVSLIAASDPDNDLNGTTQFAFDPITYTQTGVYYYLIEEINAGSTVMGVTHSTAKYVVKVTVTDPGTGILAASAEVVSGGSELAFTNIYVPQGTSANLSSTKTLTGRVLIDGEFEFTLTEKTDNTYTADKADGVKQTVKNAANGAITFQTLHFDTAGDYYYLIEEAAGSAGGVTYDGTKYKVHISVVDNLKGQLVATTTITRVIVVDEVPVESEVYSIEFFNSYAITGKDSLELQGTKFYNLPLEGNDFTFGLYDSEGNLIEEVQNAIDGSFAFSELNYTEDDVGKTYTYYVEEILPVVGGAELSSYQGITYDTTVYTVVVTVTDNGVGGITVEHTVNGAATPVVFTNEYAITGHDAVALGGTKHVTGDRTAITAGEYEFGLYEGDTLLQKTAVKADGTFSFNALTFDKDDIRTEPYAYTVREIVPADTKGVTYDPKEYQVLVYVSDNGKGGVDASYTIDGSAYTQVEFTNTYAHKSVDYVLEAVKSYTKPLKGNDFTFMLEGSGFESQTKKNDAEGKVVFDKLTFTEDGVYTFTVTETDKVLGFISYSKEVYTVKITVHDNGIGQLVVTNVAVTDSNGDPATELLFENVYVLDGEAQVTLHGTKTLSGFRTQPEDQEFAFGLYDGEGNLVQTVYNDEQGNFMFSTLTFDETYAGQTLTYTVKEILPVVDGVEVTGHEGRTYDTTVYTVVINVRDNEKGGVVIDYTINGAADTPITFANKYEAEPATVQLEGIKSYNRPLKGDDFTFVLKNDKDEVLQTKKNDADGKILFDELTFTQEGIYKYEISEVKEALGFITYTDKIYEVIVTVTDNGKGQLVPIVTVDGKTDTDVIFENIYNLTGEAEIVLEAIKAYNQTLTGGDFTFALLDADRNVLQTKTNGADGTVTFEKLTFDADDLGLHTYYVEEVLPVDEHGHELGSLNGITYDTHTYTVLVNVYDNGSGKVEATYTVDGADGADLVFTNTYTVDGHDTVELKGTKTMTGDRNSVVAGQFTFGLYYADGTEALDPNGEHITATNDADGNFAFPTLYYTKDHIGKHNYLIKEIVPAVNPTDGITYDTTVYEVEVHVVDNTQGTVDASYTVNGSAHTPIAFTNSYKHAPVDYALEATKVYKKGLKGDDFTFILTGEGFATQTKKNDKDGKILFDQLTFTDNGVYTFTVTETDKLLGFINYSKEVYTVKITVTDNGKGSLFVEKVEITDSENQPADDMVFENVYEITGTDQIVLSGSKTVTGDRSSVKDQEFTFQLLSRTDLLIEEVKNDASGRFSFSALTFDKDDIGKDIVYRVVEKKENAGGMTYDDTVYTVKVTVVDDDKGGVIATYEIVGAEEIAFTNTYVSKDVTVRLEGSKRYDKPLKGNDFTFVLKNDKGEVLQTKKNGADGRILFDELTFSEVGQYTYTVTETDKFLGFIQYSTAEYQVVIDVTDPHTGHLAANVTVTGGAGNGMIEFVNTYILDGEDYIDLVARKNFNLPLSGDEFRFGLYNDQGELLQMATNKTDGSVIFSTLTFDEADVGKTYTYYVEELLPVDEHGHELNVHYGITYDTTVYTVEVTVSDNGTGGVNAAYTVNGGDNEMVFTNTYSVTGHDVLRLEGIKYMTGDRTQLLEGETYTFELVDANGVVVDTATTDADGKFAFDDIRFDADDISGAPYTYNVLEQIPGGDKMGVTYDPVVYAVEVYVLDDGMGGVEVSHAVNGHSHDHLIFTNSYAAADATVELVGTKAYDKGLKGDDFTFVLTGEIDGAAVEQTKKNDKDGDICFDELTFTNEGTYTFKIVETDKVLGFINYSSAVYEVVITVFDNDEGELEAEVLVNSVKDGKIEFVNTYILDGEDSIVLAGTKTLTGDRELEEEEFSFGLYDAAGNLIDTAQNGADGKFAFDALTFDEADIGEEITYTVRELLPVDEDGEEMTLAMGVTYDTTVYTVTVEVKDNEEGGVEATYTVDGGEIAFVNDYQDPETVSIALNVLKDVVNKSKPGIGLDGFKFELVYDGEVVKTVKSDENGEAAFTVSFDVDHAGEQFKFKIREVKGSATGVTYDTTVHTVVVDVVRNADGSLTTLIGGEEADEVTVEFTNTYEAPSAPVTGDDFNMILIIAVMMVSAAGIFVILAMKKSQRGGKYAR